MLTQCMGIRDLVVDQPPLHLLHLSAFTLLLPATFVIACRAQLRELFTIEPQSVRASHQRP